MAGGGAGARSIAGTTKSGAQSCPEQATANLTSGAQRRKR